MSIEKQQMMNHTFSADTTMAVADIFTLAAVTTEFGNGGSFAKCSVLAGNHFNVA